MTARVQMPAKELSLDQLFPKEILEIVEAGALVQQNKVPYSHDDPITWVKMPKKWTEQQTLGWGQDKHGRPFIRLTISHKPPMVFFTYPANYGFTDLDYWNVGYNEDSLSVGAPALEFLKRFVKDEQTEMPQSILPWSPLYEKNGHLGNPWIPVR